MSENPRGRNRLGLGASATSPARPAGLVRPIAGDWASVQRFADGVINRLEVREGAARNPLEQVVLRRDLEDRLQELGVTTYGITAQGVRPGVPGDQVGIPIVSPGGGTTLTSFEKFSEMIFSSRLWQSLKFDLTDPNRFSDFPAQVRAVISEDIAAVARQRGADIRQLEMKLQTATESLAMKMQEVTASLGAASAGVRELSFAYASNTRAVAASVTTVQARLDNFSGGAPGTATVEQKMTAIADRATGLEAQYTVKVQAGGAWAGIGLAATDNGAGSATSAIILQADRVALVDASYSGSTTSPASEFLMFGVDGDGAYVGGNLKVTGKASFDGVQTLNGFQCAGHFNEGWAAIHGVIGYSKNNTAGAHGVIGSTPAVVGGTDTSTSRGIGGYTVSGQGVYALASGSGGVAVYATNTNGSTAARLGANDYAVKVLAGEGSVYFGGTVLPFTGAHPALVSKDQAVELGDILVDMTLVEAIDVSNTVMTAQPCGAVGQSGAVGVAALRQDLGDEVSYASWWSHIESHDLWFANGVGEGQVNVCGRGGDLRKGDLIVCSDLPGKGQRQPDDVVRGNTVARARCEVIFDHPDQVKLVPCIYLAG